MLKGHISKNDIHLMISVPPSISISKLVQLLKGRSSHDLMLKFDTLKKNTEVSVYGLDGISHAHREMLQMK
jgi:putative transposase